MSTSQTQSSRRIDVGYEVSLATAQRQVCLVGGRVEGSPGASRKGMVSLGIETLEERAIPGMWGTGFRVGILGR